MDQSSIQFARVTLASSLFAASGEANGMLVEGGYLHSMKRLIEKAEQERMAYPPPPRRRAANAIRRSLERLARLLRRKRAS